MIHYSCDRCQRPIDTREELRYSVCIEIQARLDDDSCDMDDDHLDELDAVLETLDDSQREELSEHAYQKLHYDLCQDCHRHYLKNPLAFEIFAKPGFSEN